MATAVHTKRFAQVWNAVTLCAATASWDITADSAEVTTSCDAQKAFLQGKYGWTVSSAGPLDIADNGADETLFTGVTGGGAASGTLLPDGTAAESATNPKYTGSMFVTSYSISLDQANAGQYTAAFQGTGAITRDVTP